MAELVLREPYSWPAGVQPTEPALPDVCSVCSEDTTLGRRVRALAPFWKAFGAPVNVCGFPSRTSLTGTHPVLISLLLEGRALLMWSRFLSV